MQTKHPNSKKVTIFRTSNFIESVQTTAKDFVSMSKKSIGSYWQSVNTRMPGSGLTFAQMKLIMPRILDVPAEDRDFQKKCTEFFSSLITSVPFEKGLELEIGLESGNTDPLGDDNLPIKPMDFVRWRHALGHPQVSATREEGLGNVLKKFYIFDAEVSDATLNTHVEQKDKAMTTYLQIRSAEPEKVKMLMTLLGLDPRRYTGKNAEDLMNQALREKADKYPEDFNKAYGQNNFEEKYVLRSMTNTGVLKLIGRKYIDPETSSVIGNNEEEAIFYLKDKENADTVMILKARMQEVLNSPLSKLAGSK